MIEPICLNYEQWQVHSFRPEELNRQDTLVQEVYRLLSDQQTLRFLPEKHLKSVADAWGWLKTAILNFHCGRNYVHLITEKASGKMAGIIDIIPTSTSREYYTLEHYPYFIEFYLGRKAIGQKLMSSLLPLVLKALEQRDICQLAAAVNRQNHAARKVLKNSGFVYQGPFDGLQDLYLVQMSGEFGEIRRAG